MKNEIIEITSLCANIRKALDENKAATTLFTDFPKGCCRDTSLLVNLFLIEGGYSNATYCYKEIDDYIPSHAWLEYDGYIIDITADQFELGLPPVIVVPIVEAAFLYQPLRKEPAHLSIAGIDAIPLMQEFTRIKEFLFRYNVEKYLRQYMPSVIELLNGQQISWTTINKNFRAYIADKKEKLGSNPEIIEEATFFSILYRKQRGYGDTDAMFFFFDTIFTSLNSVLSDTEKRLLHRMITKVFSSLNKNYLNFIGELATLNYFMIQGRYELINIEEKIHRERNISIDIYLRHKEDNRELLIEVLNIHLEHLEFQNEIQLKKHLESKLTEKIDSKCINPERVIIIQPVIWIKSEEQLKSVFEFYTNTKFLISQVEKPFVYASYQTNSGPFEHKFDYIQEIFKN